MVRKLRGRDYIRGFSLLLAVFLLFQCLVWLGTRSPSYKQIPQVRNNEGSSHSFRFAFLADIHKGWGVFKPIINKIGRDGYVVTVIGGDIVANSSEDKYRFFLKELAQLRGKTSISFVPGNHDVYDKSTDYSLKNFHKYCGPDHYWFSRGDVAFVVLNDAQSKIPENQFRWLESTLRKLRGTVTHIFVFMHVPPFDPRPGHNYCLPKKDGERFMVLMEQYGVAYVLSGHIHCYFKEIINGVTYIVAPPAGGTSRCFPPSYGYIQITLNGEGIKDSVVTAEDKWWPRLKGDIHYELCARTPFLLPLFTVVLGQSFFYGLVL